MNKEFKVGLLLVISGTLLYFSFNFLKGKDFFSSTNKFYVQYADIAGLTISNPVIINGFAVGRVDEIKILHDKKDSLQVMIVVNDDVFVNDLTVAELISSDILGGKAIKLELNKGTQILESGSFVKSKVEESLVARIQKTAVPVITNVDTIVNDFKKYMRGENERNITKSIEGLRLMIEEMNKFSKNLNATLSQNSGNINETGDNLKVISGKINDEMKNINKILKNVNNITDSISQVEFGRTIESANASLKSVNSLMTNINNQQGSIGKLINSPEIHQNLNATIKDIDYLVTDMQANPRRYIQFSVVGGTPKDEKAMIKSFNEKSITNQIVIELKRDAPSMLTIKLFKQDRSSIEVIPEGLGTKTITVNLPSEFKSGYYLAKLDWFVGSEAFQFEVK
jgi:phospholipid/cholesterol/gamma-HCH transport system substrate-binding protein